MKMRNLPVPEYAKNMRMIGHSDIGGRPDAVQVMVQNGYAYVGHMFSGGFSVVDVRDPRDPKPVEFIAAPPNTWTLHLQAHDDLLLVVNAKDLYKDAILQDEKQYYVGSMRDKIHAMEEGYSAGMRVYDISKPETPREIGFMPVEGVGTHRIWYSGGRWAYVSAMLDGFSDFIFLTVDLADPTSPKLAGKFWLSGMNMAAGEKPTWDDKTYRYACHHGIVAGDTAYVTWRDGGVALVDVADRHNPKLISHRSWAPPYGGGSHNALPLPARNLLVVVDEAVLNNGEDGLKHTWIFDIREKSNPISIATLPTPNERDYFAKGGHFGPHNVHENRPGSFVSDTLIFATYNNAGVRIFDISNAYEPKEIAALVPPAPEKLMDHRPGVPRVLNMNDVFVTSDRTIFATDMNGGLYVLEADI